MKGTMMTVIIRTATILSGICPQSKMFSVSAAARLLVSSNSLPLFGSQCSHRRAEDRIHLGSATDPQRQGFASGDRCMSALSTEWNLDSCLVSAILESRKQKRLVFSGLIMGEGSGERQNALMAVRYDCGKYPLCEVTYMLLLERFNRASYSDTISYICIALGTSRNRA
ncbi:hypothetical protein M3J09_013819 [Ascochyta lentis]